jgi:hypothetical protein
MGLEVRVLDLNRRHLGGAVQGTVGDDCVESLNVPVKVPAMYATENPTFEWILSTAQAPAGRARVSVMLICAS